MDARTILGVVAGILNTHHVDAVIPVLQETLRETKETK